MSRGTRGGEHLFVRKFLTCPKSFEMMRMVKRARVRTGLSY